MGFPRQDWRDCHFLLQRIEPRSPAWQVDSLPIEPLDHRAKTFFWQQLCTPLSAASCSVGFSFSLEILRNISKNRRIEQGRRMHYPRICLFGVKSILSWLFWEVDTGRKSPFIRASSALYLKENVGPETQKHFVSGEWICIMNPTLSFCFVYSGLPINLSWAPPPAPHPLAGMSGLGFIWVFLGSMIDLKEFWLKPFVVLVNHSQ